MQTLAPEAAPRAADTCAIRRTGKALPCEWYRGQISESAAVGDFYSVLIGMSVVHVARIGHGTNP